MYTIRSITEISEILEVLMESMGMETGSSFVEPSNILTFAGLKGNNYLYSLLKPPDDIDVDTKINQLLNKYGLRVWLALDEKFSKVLVQGDLESLTGMENKTKNSKIILPKFLVPVFDATSGFEGLKVWKKVFRTRLDELVAKGEISDLNSSKQIFSDGIRLGYPDQAILDFDLHLRTDRKTKSISSLLLSAHPFAQIYAGAHPDFFYAPDSWKDAEILIYIETAKKVLVEFYTSDWFTKLESSSKFRNAYAKFEFEHKKAIEERRANL